MNRFSNAEMKDLIKRDPIFTESCDIYINGKLFNWGDVVNEKILSVRFVLKYEKKYTDCHFKWFDIVSNDPAKLADVEWQTNEICVAAIKKDPFSVEHVKNQKQDFTLIHGCLGFGKDPCLFAIRMNPKTITKIRDPCFNLCVIALSIDGLLLKDVIDKYKGRKCHKLKDDVIMLTKIAIKQNSHALLLAPYKTAKLCRLAVSKAENIPFEMAEIAVKEDGLLIKIVIGHFLNGKDITKDAEILIRLAIKQNVDALTLIPIKTLKLCDLEIQNHVGREK